MGREPEKVSASPDDRGAQPKIRKTETMFDSNALAQDVLRNCTISDATHAGQFSICGLALRLRDLYKWEHRLEPWEEGDSRQVLAWIGDREENWEGVAQDAYGPLRIGARVYDPFDTQGVNAQLAAHGLYYGAGYAHSLKPTFYLAEVREKFELHGYPVLVLGRELARDLLTLPALSQDNSIIVRREAARLFLWDQMTYIKPSGKAAFKWSLARCGITEANPESLRSAFDRIFAVQVNIFIYHELGEIADTIFDRTVWREIIAAYPHSPTELLARAIKDLLADTGASGPLAHIIQQRDSAALALYVAFSDGLVRELFPHIKTAFKQFTTAGQWQTIAQAVADGHAAACSYAQQMSRIYLEGKRKDDLAWAAEEIERRLL